MFGVNILEETTANHKSEERVIQVVRAYAINGYWWIGFETYGRLHLVYRVGRVGDCVRF